ncbi:hypothetical protein KRMM14A1259_02710 [Krasilnikovia sp. MM14-A1259]
MRDDDPRQIGSYQLLARLGEGGMGAVYLAQDLDGRQVALKRIRPELGANPEFRARFRSEVNRARQVPPFCTAAVLDADPDHPTPYLVVEYVEGSDLGQLIRRNGPLRGGNLHSVAVGVATALAAIHSAGVIHRDLKPNNVLFSVGTPKVIDFGIARAADSATELTRPDQMVGTVPYMAPERFASGDERRPDGPAADIFAWGVLVAYAATGRTPFEAGDPASTAAKILTQEPDLTGVPGPLRGPVTAALAKNPDDRPTASELLDGLLTVGDLAQPWRRPSAQSRPRSRRTATLLAVAGVALLAVVAGVAGIGHWRSPTRSAAAAPPGTLTPPPNRFAEDFLDTPSTEDGWRPASGCRVQDDGLAILPHNTPTQRCPGPFNASNMVLTVDVLPAGNAYCPAIWLRTGADRSLLIRLCPDLIRAGSASPDYGNGLDFAEAKPVMDDPLEWHRVLIVANGPYLDVSVDGRRQLHSDKATPQAAGGLALGVALGADGVLSAQDVDDPGATFRNMHVLRL